MMYIRGTIYIPLILSDNGGGDLKWWIDASYAIDQNMWGHTGGVVSVERGFPIVALTNQNLNTCSSTESDIIVVYNCIPAVCWTRYFTEYQGCQVVEIIVYQDNNSTIILENNGKSSNSNNTNHINIHFFFITGRISEK